MKKAPIVFGTLLVVAGLAGSTMWYVNRNRESTDDAQIEGHIVNVSSRVTGQVQRVLVRDNQHVKQGEPLLELDFTELETRVAAAKADLSAAQAGMVSSETDVSAAQSRLKLARTELDRVQKLFHEGVLPQAELDTRKSQFDQAQASYDQAIAKLGNSGKKGGAVGAALARVEQAAAALKLAEVNLSYATIRAPIAGVVSRRTVEAGQMVGPGAPLLAIVAIDNVWIVANFKEDQIARMGQGQKAVVKVDAYGKYTFNAEIESLAAASGSKFALIPPDNASGNFVKVVQRIPVLLRFTDVVNADGDPRVIRPGMNVTATVLVDSLEKAGHLKPAAVSGNPRSN